MDIEWDNAKAASNLAKHGVSFDSAIEALSDPNLLTWEDPDAEGEQRFVSLGMDAVTQVLVVIHTDRNGTTRIISARRATKRETRSYAKRI